MKEKSRHSVGTIVGIIALVLIAMTTLMLLPNLLSSNTIEVLSRKSLNNDFKPPFRFTIRTTVLKAGPQSGVKIRCLHPRSERGTAVVHMDVETDDNGLAIFEIKQADLVTDPYYWFSVADPEFVSTGDVGISPIEGRFDYTFQVLPTKAFSMKIVDNNNMPVSNAQIWIRSDYPGFYAVEHTQSDLKGLSNIRFPPIPVNIVAIANKYASSFIQSVELPVDKLYVIKLDDGMKIIGRVIDEKNNPVSELEIMAKKDAPYHNREEFKLRGTTDKDGNFVLHNASEGKWNLLVVGGAGQPCFIRPLEIVVKKNSDVNLQNIIAERGFCVRGQYITKYKIDLRRHGPNHLISTNIYHPRIPGWDLMTSEDGTFTVWGLPCEAEGDIEFAGIKGFYQFIETPDDSSFFRIYPNNRIRYNNVSPGIYDGFKVHFLLSGRARVSVVDALGNPLANLRVLIYPSGSVYRTNSNGQFIGEIPPIDPVTVRVKDPTSNRTIFSGKLLGVKEGELLECRIVINNIQ